MSITKTKTEKKSSYNWIQHEEKYYTSDDLINAYLKGKEEQKNSGNKELSETLDKNFKKAQKIVESLNKKIIDLKFDIYEAYLRIIDINRFDTIFAIKQDDYLLDEFDSVYDLSRNLEKKNNKNGFYIDIIFMPYTKNLNKDSLISNTYYFTYAKKGQA